METFQAKFRSQSIVIARFGAVLLALVGVLIAGLAGCGGQEKEDVQKIPLKEIFSTSGQKDLKRVEGFLHQGATNRLNEMNRKTIGQGASNIFLVRGGDINQAVLATGKVFLGGWSVENSVQPGDFTTSDNHWGVVYFGVSASSPPQWLIQSATHKNQIIEIHFRKTNPKISTRDIHQYFVWVPLGQLKQGNYTLKLIDDQNNQTSLTRQVSVTNN